jgi:8-oxo-dGTP pyrophosphatase MutT (NUDIX family)/deoxyadenosine/deoxycytidine kinase
MAKKIINPKNSVVIEGLWTLGKTTIAQAYCNKYKYLFIPEPFHTRGENAENIVDINAWYLQEHKRREVELQKEAPVLFERSILSTFAFHYALERPLPNDSYIASFQKILQDRSILVVYLKMNEELLLKKDTLVAYSKDIQHILLNEKARNRYEEWYTKILPLEYEITPFILRGLEGEKRRSLDEITNEIHLVLKCNRVAQVNVVCFTESEHGRRFLTLKRNEQKGGFWQTLTGGIHAGEGALQAAIREVREEIALDSGDFELTKINLSYFFQGDDGYLLDEYVFACKVKDISKVRISEEHDECEWLSAEDAEKRVKFDSNKAAISFTKKYKQL